MDVALAMPGRPRARVVLFALLALLLPQARPAVAHEDLELQARQVTTRLSGERDNAVLYLERGRLRQLARDLDGAARDYDIAASLDPALTAIALCRASLKLDQGDPVRAAQEIHAYITRDAVNPRAWELQASINAALGRTLDAVGDLDRVLALEPRPSPDLYLRRAELLASLPSGDLRSIGRLERALDGLNEARAKLGDLVSIEFAAIDIELRLGRFTDALTRLGRLAPQFERADFLAAKRREIIGKSRSAPP